MILLDKPPPPRALLELLSGELVETILSEALQLLETHGVTTPNQAAVALAGEHGLDVDIEDGRIRIGADAVERALRTAPAEVVLYSRDGSEAMRLGGLKPHFNPGSAAIAVLDAGAMRSRPPTLADCARLSRLTEELPHLAGQSTGLVPADVPRECADWVRLFCALMYSRKPVITGTFREGSLAVMRELLLAVRHSEEELRAKPLAIADCCPSPPLRWGAHIAQDVIDAARWGIPVEFISMPALGSVAPVTLVPALVQHTAETLSGVVLAQLAAPGAPVIYGGSPSLFDMRHQTTPMGAIESMMLMCGYAQIGRRLGLPTHGYLGLSDSKLVDAQAGAESAAGAVLGVLAGVNNMSGPGMLELESCMSLEKLVLDNDICGMALQLAGTISAHPDDLPCVGLCAELLSTGHLLSSDHTLRHFREHFYPEVMSRSHRDEWLRAGSRDSAAVAAGRVEELLSAEPILPDTATREALVGVARSAAPQIPPAMFNVC